MFSRTYYHYGFEQM